ncbi:AtpZ/AtpI family protein [uncultured Pseudodesulfovibrio sp.]|uniref:AtpZ/AtpI family protein n=1 Tax=uncultured Pseudodesulfovibrio sp. TaxID=2035858 RepID=UPI0029C7C694|nr:AtpZ/AtpI family protein [uncultured Pseudodesulfovibrio sp.]
MTEKERNRFPREVGSKERRKLRAKQEPEIGAWYGLGLFGVVGWSVAIPTLLGIMLGVWIDLTWPSPRSWTLMLLVGGLGLGCTNAWLWLGRQKKRILEEREREQSDDN